MRIDEAALSMFMDKKILHIEDLKHPLKIITGK